MKLRIREFYGQRQRAVLSVVFACLLMLITACGGTPTAVEPPTYTPEQVELIERYTADLDALRNRVSELSTLIADEDWSDVQNLIHGPLGDLRFKMLTIARNLSPDLQPRARSLSKSVFNDLVKIDAAAEEQDIPQATDGYNQLVGDYDRFLDAIPPELPTS